MLAPNPWWRPTPSRTRVPLLVLVTALVASGAVVWLVHVGIAERDEARFRNAVHATSDRMQARLDAYTAVLRAGRAFFIANGMDVDAERFHRFVAEQEVQERYPGIQGVGFSRRLTRDQLDAVVNERRRDGLPDYQVWPMDDRQELHAILFLEPLDRRNRVAMGYDMFTEATRREAMERARDTGKPAASGAITLVQEIDANKQQGFNLYLPLYEGGVVPATLEERRRKLLGFVYAPFRVDDLLAGIFGTERNHRVTFSIHDGRRPDAPVLHVAADMTGNARFSGEQELEVGGRTWVLRFESLPSLERASSRWLFPFVVAGALVVSALLFLLAMSQSRAQEQYRVHSRIIDSMTEGVSVSDERGTILYTNPAEDEMFGYARGELIGKPITMQNSYPARDNERIVGEVIAQLRERGVWTGEFANVKKDGTAFTTYARISALTLAGKSYWVCVQEDITLRKQAEREREDLLERERAANRAKDEFIALVSHELRNPLAPIAAAVELLAVRGVPGIERETRIIERQLRHLRNVVDDLLDVSAITHGGIRLSRQPIQLAAVVADARALAMGDIEDRQHELRIDVPTEGLTVDVDRERMVQVITKLLGNAAKYTDRGGRIEIHARKEADNVVLRVRDNGIGVDPEVLPTLFRPFMQGDRRVEQAKGGMGLGLALVQGLVHAHGGTVEARSEGRGTGSEFIVRLPASPVEVAAPPQPAPSSRKPRVLVVDDNQDAADLLGEVLETAGYEVCVAYHPVRAIELVRDTPADAAILDIGLPEMDGYELATKLAGTSRPVLIALTGYGRDDDRARSRSAGFAHHFVKPVSPQTILAALAGLGDDASRS